MNEFERDLRKEKTQHIDKMREIMNAEKEKFRAFSSEDGHLETKITSIYKKMANA